jgi:hypothetical protein
MTIHPLFAGILSASGLPQTGDTREALLRDLKEYLYIAGNQLCDDCHDVLSHQASSLIRRINAALNEEM